MKNLLDAWTEDPGSVKKAFLELHDALLRRPHTFSHFVSRPAISYSLRVGIREGVSRYTRPLFALVDIVDGAPGERWLSVCFYADMVTDPENLGNLVPRGLLGEDGHCFDLTAYDKEVLGYLMERIEETYKKALSFRTGTEHPRS